jgi:alpha-galactosidase
MSIVTHGVGTSGPVRLAIIGAGSATFAATVIRDLCVHPRMGGSRVALMDVDAHRLEMVRGLAVRLARELGADMTFATTLDRREALDGAQFVINTAQTGGHDWTEAQRTLTEKHGYYRGAGVVNGDGGMHSYGQMGLMLEIARDIERLCPEAWLIQSSNPVFEGCTLMTRESSVKVVGLCHGHFGYRGVAKVLGLELEHVTAEMPGFNHWIWMTDFRYKGEDAYPLLDEWIAKKSESYWKTHKPTFSETQMSRAAIHQYRLFGRMPIGDTPRFAGWWYQADIATRKAWYGTHGGFDSEIGWAQYLERIGERVEAVEKAALDQSVKVTDLFPPRASDEQIVPIIDALAHDVQGRFQVNVPNRGPVIQGFPEDLVIECQAVVDRSGIRPVTVPPLPPRLVAAAMVPRWHKAELLVESFRGGDRGLLLNYLLFEPRTRTLEQAEETVAEWLGDPRNAAVARRFSQGGRA